jgi:signal transduction histidine kinase
MCAVTLAALAFATDDQIACNVPHFKQTGPVNLPRSTRVDDLKWKSPLAVSRLCLAFWLATAGQAVPSAVTEAHSERLTTIETVFIDGAGQPLRKDQDWQLRVSPGRHRVEFRFGPTQVAADKPLRLQYRLAGFDDEWHEAGGEMRVLVISMNSSNEVIAYDEFAMRGKSEGWGGTPAAAHLTERHERLTLGKDVDRLSILFISGGWQNVVGWAAIDDFKVWATNRAGGAVNLCTNSSFEAGLRLDQPDGLPDGWTRGGFNSSMAKVLRLPAGSSNHVLVLDDNNLRSYCEWRTELPLAGHAQAGDTLSIEWKEAFSIGAGGSLTVAFGMVPPGTYRFEARATSHLGEPNGRTTTLTLVMPQVFWKTPWFITLTGLIGAVILAAGVRFVTQRRMRRELERLEQQRALDRERARIARDIHDHLGTSLTRIGLLSQSLRARLGESPRPGDELDEICTTAEEITRDLDETVWAVDPAHDSLDSVANYLGRFAQEFLKDAAIQCRLDLPLELPSIPFAAGLRHNLFLAFKEALNNIVRHAGATQVRVRLTVDGEHMVLAVEDNGKGFPPAPANEAANTRRPGPGGRGLQNLKHRLAQSGGELVIQSGPGQGTRLQMTVPLKPSGRATLAVPSTGL